MGLSFNSTDYFLDKSDAGSESSGVVTSASGSRNGSHQNTPTESSVNPGQMAICIEAYSPTSEQVKASPAHLHLIIGDMVDGPLVRRCVLVEAAATAQHRRRRSPTRSHVAFQQATLVSLAFVLSHADLAIGSVID
ncbi:unnamed protein product [Notodromas monacha]|uniref:Uncharacterized protein n=1 Tax=Notodromas monacha TaxID=399045 RepID=A0A7R9GGH0_9CRUS|nr:unnamed protein product [Notodromas monacha]CAG0920183.1 unnamed protein product [Notodromas monacha]